MNENELSIFYTRIGAAIWHIQYLEDVLIIYLATKHIHQKRVSGQRLLEEDAQAILAVKRRMTLGQMIKESIKLGLILPKDQPRFDSFKEERHWLVHRSLFSSGDDLSLESTRNMIFQRIRTIEKEAQFLRDLVMNDFETWIAAQKSL